MERYKGQWCVTIAELTKDDRTPQKPADYLKPIMDVETYKNYKRYKKLVVVRRGGGAKNPALISYESLPDRIKTLLQMKYPDMEERQRRERNPAYNLFREAYSKDYEALSYYHRILREMNKSLSDKRIDELATEYCINASVIQAVIKIRQDNKLYCKVRGSRGRSWADMAEVIKFYQSEYGHTLGASPTRFASWVRKYEQEGYPVLISKKFGNTNTVKMNVMTERLLMELAYDPHRPYNKTVWEWYCKFLRGEVEHYNSVTGEAYDPADYPDLSEKTVGDILKKKLNKSALSKQHDSRHDYQTTMRAHHKRIKPKFSLSMVSMDDKDFGVKIRWQKLVRRQVRGRQEERYEWVETALKAYICYDVASEAIIGYCFSGEKNRDIFEGCVKSMYRNLLNWGLGQPYEAQVENHLVSLYKESMMQSGHLFPRVTFAGAENSQEKYAERYNGTLKLQFEKYSVSEPIGRPHARLAENRTKNRKVSDSANNNYLVSVYDYEEAVRLYEQIIEMYNNAPHPKQKLYPNKSRIEVLMECVHPDIKPIDMVSLARWAGEYRESHVNDRGLIRADYEDYSVSPSIMESLRGRDAKVTAYWWRQYDEQHDDINLSLGEQEARKVQEIYLYQDDIYLGKCPRVVPYQVSVLERTDDDMRLMAQQKARIAEWDKEVAARRSEGIVSISAEASKSIEIAPIKKVVMPLDTDAVLEDDIEAIATKAKDYASQALADL